MSSFKQKMSYYKEKQNKTQSKETKTASESDLADLADFEIIRKFETTRFNMLRF